MQLGQQLPLEAVHAPCALDGCGSQAPLGEACPGLVAAPQGLHKQNHRGVSSNL